MNQPKQRSINNKDELTTLKKSCHLFSQLHIACQVRDGNLDEFFMHENAAFPPSLSKNGSLRSGNKADLTGHLRELVVTEAGSGKIEADCVILDGAAVVNMLKPNGSSTFREYANKEFTQFIQNQIVSADRLDIVWDVYIENSLKLAARTKRGLYSCITKNFLFQSNLKRRRNCISFIIQIRGIMNCYYWKIKMNTK